MSYYTDLTADFALKRVPQVLDKDPCHDDREVTRLLCSLWPLIVIPVERLGLPKLENGNWTQKKIEKDLNDESKSFEYHHEKFIELCNEPLCDWISADGVMFKRADRTKNEQFYFEKIDRWVSESPHCCPNVGDAIVTMRHALSHANLWFGGIDDPEKIEVAVFGNLLTQSNPQVMSAIRMPIDALREIREKWQSWLNEILPDDQKGFPPYRLTSSEEAA